MLTLKDRNFEVRGDLVDFDVGSNEIYVRFKNDKELKISMPSQQLLSKIKSWGLLRLRDATIDLSNGRIEIPMPKPKVAPVVVSAKK